MRDVAERTGRQTARVSEIEAGKANATVDTLAEIGGALGLSLIFVPEDKLEQVTALLEGTSPRTKPLYDAGNVFHDVFVDDSGDLDDDPSDARP